MSQRSYYFDNVKFLLIMLVIVGHILPLCMDNPLVRGVYAFIFAFHMPLFVFISGYFTNIDNKEKFQKGIRRIAETLICFTLIHYSLQLILGKAIGIRSFIEPAYTLWYLWCLIYWRIMLYVSKPNPSSFVFIAVSLFFFTMACFVPISSILAFQRTFFFFPFFCFGYYARNKNLINKLTALPFSASLLTITTVLIITIILTTISIPVYIYYHYFLYGVRHFYMSFSFPITLYIGIRFFNLFLAILISVCLLRVMPHKEFFFTKYGKDSLFFYVYHSVLIVLLNYCVDAFSLPHSFPYCMVYFLLIIVLLFVMNKITFFKKVINPVTNIFA